MSVILLLQRFSLSGVIHEIHSEKKLNEACEPSCIQRLLMLCLQRHIKTVIKLCLYLSSHLLICDPSRAVNLMTNNKNKNHSCLRIKKECQEIFFCKCRQMNVKKKKTLKHIGWLISLALRLECAHLAYSL